jgi:tRNA G18 (ribose-2'-O)-methylase SpoU
MALVPPFGISKQEVVSLLAPLRNDVSIAIYNCQNAFAVGAMIRVAHSFLVREIIVVGEPTWYEKASMGMEHYEHIVRVADASSFVEHVGGRPLWAIEKDHATVGLYDVVAYPPDVVLVFGSERAGLPAEIVEHADEVVGIPMFGINHSFPVAVAAGIVLSDWGRRRYAPGSVVVGPKRASRLG